MVKAEILLENGGVSLEDIFPPELIPQKKLEIIYVKTLIQKRLDWKATGQVPLDNELKKLVDQDETMVERLAKQREIIYRKFPISDSVEGNPINQSAFVVPGEITIGEIRDLMNRPRPRFR